MYRNNGWHINTVLIALNVHLIGCNVLAEELPNLGEHELEQHEQAAEENDEDRDVQADECDAYESVPFAVRHITIDRFASCFRRLYYLGGRALFGGRTCFLCFLL